ncbi:hypothetical protein ADU59_10880 [Pararhizobium polonicum]|uniref:Acyl-CoA acyltransferase n=1 Tax=Pararhizobium polonicum TaxID=1612624 RepID=A0A1C7P4B5_9HYPH|nr:hypothetical protein [Pararhizobium polonicum]OBZ95836.1 hypothetical protein ADU59_10880 [Pararhizobium polonicum]
MAVLGAFPAGLVCRPIHEDDWEGVIACLGRGFPQRHRSHWVRALARMAQRSAIADFPRYGFVLAMEERIVGVLLALYYTRQGQEGEEIRCNLSSWAVDEEFRPYAGKMVIAALRRKNVTYINVSPAPETMKINEALGFRRYSNGQFAFLPALGSVRRPYRILEVRPDLPELMLLSESERGILLEHAALGCRSLVCVRDGRAFPFVFKTRRVFHGLVPCSQVIYCRSALELAQCAGPIGRFLLRKGILLCVVDANKPVLGLTGRYFGESGPKYFKGPKPPSLGDLTFTEFVIFGS